MRNCCSTLRHAYRCGDAEVRLLQMSPGGSPESTSPVEQHEATKLNDKSEVQQAGQRRIEIATQEVRRLNIDELLTPLSNVPGLQNTADPMRSVGQGLSRQVEDGAPVDEDLTLSTEPIPTIPQVIAAEPLQQPNYAAIAASTDTAPSRVANPIVSPDSARSKPADAETTNPKSTTETSTVQPNAAPSTPTSGTESLSGNIPQAEQQAALSGARQELQGKNPATMTEGEVQKLLGQTMLRYGVNVSVENGAFRVEAPRTSMDKMINILMGAVSYFTAIANELGERMGKGKKSEASQGTPAPASEAQTPSTTEGTAEKVASVSEQTPVSETAQESMAQLGNSVEKQVINQMNELSRTEGLIFQNGEFIMKLQQATLHIRFDSQTQKWQMRSENSDSQWTSDFALEDIAPQTSSLQAIPVIGTAFVGSRAISFARNTQQSFETLRKVAHFNAVLDSIRSQQGSSVVDSQTSLETQGAAVSTVPNATSSELASSTIVAPEADTSMQAITAEGSDDSSSDMQERALEYDEKEMLNRLTRDTMTVINDRIERADIQMRQGQKEVDDVTWGERFNSTFLLAGLLGTTAQESQEMVVQMAQKVINNLQNKRAEIMNMSGDIQDRIKTVSRVRSELGLTALPIDLVDNYDEFQKMRREGLQSRDKTAEMNFAELNQKLKESEVVLDRWEQGIELVDTGVSIAAGFVPGGAETYMFIRSTGDVLAGTKTPEEAALDFAIGVVAARVGGKAVSKLGVDKAVKEWAKKNAAKFTKQAAEAVAKSVAQVSKGASQGAAIGGLNAAAHSSIAVANGEMDMQDAVANTLRGGATGAAVGAAIGTLQSASTLRSSASAAQPKAASTETPASKAKAKAVDTETPASKAKAKAVDTETPASKVQTKTVEPAKAPLDKFQHADAALSAKNVEKMNPKDALDLLRNLAKNIDIKNAENLDPRNLRRLLSVKYHPDKMSDANKQKAMEIMQRINSLIDKAGNATSYDTAA